MSETICYFKSGIGNYILATPAFQALASMDPTGKIDLCLAKEYIKDSRHNAVREMAEHAPFIDQIVEWPRNGYKRWFIPVQSETSHVGHFIQRHTKHHKNSWPGAAWKRQGTHEIMGNMVIVQALGYDGPIPLPYIPCAPGPKVGLNRPLIALCNSSFGTEVWRKKRWTGFPALAKRLRERWGASVIGVGGKDDLLEVDLDRDFCGKTTITETAAILKQADAFVSTDTGCMHIGSYLGIPTIGLFGGTLTTKNAPLGKRSVALKATIWCAPCQYEARFFTCRYYACMESIRPKDVMEVLENMIPEVDHLSIAGGK